MNFFISELFRGLDTLGVWINFGLTFWAFGSIIFFVTLALRGLFVYKETYVTTMRLTIVVVCFGGELIMVDYPHLFMLHMANIIFAVGGALIGRMAAEMWAIHREKLVRNAKTTASILDRYKGEVSKEDINEAVMEQ